MLVPGARLRRAKGAWAAVLLMATASVLPARADDFYKDKTVTIIISTGVGGNDDLITKGLTRHMPAYLPGHPNMIAQNMPGAGNVLATNYLYNIAPKDGTTFGTVNKGIVLHQVLDGRGVRYDAGKFNWLGSAAARNTVVVAWRDSGVATMDDVMKREVILGGTGPGSDIVMVPAVMNNVLGTKFKIVIGYKSLADIDLAMARGEVEARTNSYGSILIGQPDWLRDHKINILVQAGVKKDPEISAYMGREVPLLTDLAASDEQRSLLKLITDPITLGYPFLAPPDLPPERVALLRAAFTATLKDPGFLADMAKARFDVNPLTGKEVADIVRNIISPAPEIIEKAKAAMGPAAEGGSE
jgi:tripartite-type tricarboxylate transporter receptor subunit TctC